MGPKLEPHTLCGVLQVRGRGEAGWKGQNVGSIVCTEEVLNVILFVAAQLLMVSQSMSLRREFTGTNRSVEQVLALFVACTSSYAHESPLN